MKLLQKAALFAASLNVLVGCSAEDLGDEPPLAIAVDTVNPTFANGVGEVLKQKCANCHAAAPTQFAPANVPRHSVAIKDLDTEAFYAGGDQKKSGQAFTVLAKIFLDTHYPMPTEFATPLTDDEKTALKGFLASKGFTLAGLCPTTTTTLTYADVKSNIDSSCAFAGCHGAQAAGIAPLATFEQNRLLRSKSLAYIVSNFMPIGTSSAFVATTAGARVREWLCGGADLN